MWPECGGERQLGAVGGSGAGHGGVTRSPPGSACSLAHLRAACQPSVRTLGIHRSVPVAPGLRDGDTWNLGVQPGAPMQPLAPGRGGRQEGAPGTGPHHSSQRSRKDWSGPRPTPPWPGRQVDLVQRGDRALVARGSHPGPPYAAFCPVPRAAAPWIRATGCRAVGTRSFAPSHRLPHRGEGLSPAVGTADRSAGEGYGLVAWVGKAAAPDPILGEMEGSSWVWLLPREVGESPIQLGHVLSSQRPSPRPAQLPSTRPPLNAQPGPSILAWPLQPGRVLPRAGGVFNGPDYQVGHFGDNRRPGSSLQVRGSCGAL